MAQVAGEPLVWPERSARQLVQVARGGISINEFPTLLGSRRPDHFRHRSVRRWQYSRPSPRAMVGSAGPAPEESRGGGVDVRSAGRLLPPGPCLRYFGGLASI